MSTETKALEFLKTNKSVKDRAEQYAPRIAESLKVEIILPLKEKIAQIDDEIFDLEDFSLDTNLNKGQKQMTKDDCQERFKKIIEKTFEKELLELELKTKSDKFKELFGEV